MGIEGETEGKTNNIRKEKQSTPSPTARTEQAQEPVRTVVLARFPRNPIVTIQELRVGEVGAWCEKR